MLNNLTDEQILIKLNMFSKEVNKAGKTGMSAEKERVVFVREAHRRNIIGMKSKKKWREF